MEYRELVESAIGGTHDLAVETGHEGMFRALRQLVVARGRTDPADVPEHLDAAERQLRRVRADVSRVEPGIDRILTDIDRSRRAIARVQDVREQPATDPAVRRALAAAEAELEQLRAEEHQPMGAARSEPSVLEVLQAAGDEVDRLKREQQPPVDADRRRVFPGPARG